jgi:hypothetical protein
VCVNHAQAYCKQVYVYVCLVQRWHCCLARLTCIVRNERLLQAEKGVVHVGAAANVLAGTLTGSLLLQQACPLLAQ